MPLKGKTCYIADTLEAPSGSSSVTENQLLPGHTIPGAAPVCRWTRQHTKALPLWALPQAMLAP